MALATGAVTGNEFFLKNSVRLSERAHCQPPLGPEPFSAAETIESPVHAVRLLGEEKHGL